MIEKSRESRVSFLTHHPVVITNVSLLNSPRIYNPTNAWRAITLERGSVKKRLKARSAGFDSEFLIKKSCSLKRLTKYAISDFSINFSSRRGGRHIWSNETWHPPLLQGFNGGGGGFSLPSIRNLVGLRKIPKKWLREIFSFGEHSDTWLEFSPREISLPGFSGGIDFPTSLKLIPPRNVPSLLI